MLNRFTLYDFIAVLIPGIFFLWAVRIFMDIPILESSIPISGGLTDTSILIVIGYITGLLLQGISQLITQRLLLWWWGGFPSDRWLLPEEQKFTSEFKTKLLSTFTNKFGIEYKLDSLKQEPRSVLLRKNHEIFFLCYRSLEKLSEIPQVFNAQYGLFRTLLTTFILLFIISFIDMICEKFDREFVVLFLLSTFGIFISYVRVSKRADDLSRSVYDIFLVNFGKLDKN